MADFSSVITGVAVPSAVYAVFALARKWLPASSDRLPSKTPPMDELESRFTSIQWKVGSGMFAVGIAFALVTYNTLLLLQRVFVEAEGPAYFRLLPESAIWWFLPGFGAIALSWEITLFLWRRFGDCDEAALYMYWGHRKAGFNSTKVLRIMALFLVVPIGILTLLATPMHTTLHDDSFRIREYASLQTHSYKYSDVRRLTVVDGYRDRSGTFDSRAGIVVDFSDGRRWSSADNRDQVTEVDSALLEFLVKKTGLPAGHTQTEDDLR
jgi:hypothetical protein